MFNYRKMSTAIIKKGNKYLLLKRSFLCKLYWAQWQLPEGGIKKDEKEVDALKRELKEETNLDLISYRKIGKFFSKIKYFGITFWNFERIIFHCKVKGNIKRSFKHSGYKWFNKDDIKNIKLLKGIEFEKIKKYL